MSETFSIEELKIAFAFRITHMVMEADEVLHPEEVRFIERVFERQALDACGYLEEGERGFSSRFAAALARAAATLPEELSEAEKLDMMDIFVDAAKADGQVDPREVTVLLQAARMLQLERETVVPYLDRKLDRGHATIPPPPRELTTTALREGPALLALTQEQIFKALGGAPDDAASADLARLEAVLDNPEGFLILAVDAEDVRAHAYHGFQALMRRLTGHERLVEMAGRMAFTIDGYEDDERDLHEIPETREWMAGLLDPYPWLPVWISPESGVASLMIASACVFDPEEEDWLVDSEFLANAVKAANYAIAITAKMGSDREDHVHAFLAQFGVDDIPEGFFDGLEDLQTELDGAGRVSQV